ncbi:MAG: tRNA lysidine(34) synthetase TilS [Prevotellaceae bacterium]|nr:tRNA lysidine(34) synthetase TilS [Prevotellaceae bacterium]
MKIIQHKVKSYIENNRLLDDRQKIIAGFSGGADSVALLHILHSLDYQCVAVHCNFHLRGEESVRDQIFAESFCRRLNIPFISVDFDTVKHAQMHKMSIEMAARELRYDFFEKTRTAQNAQAIAVAHHADDHVETMLMNLMRGTGLKGMAGIPMRNGHVVRPLLCVTRCEIERYVEAHQLQFVTDSSNKENIYARNKIRNQLLPLMEEINPSVKQTLNESATRFKDYNIIVQHYVEQAEKNIIRKDEKYLKIDIRLLKQLPGYSTVLFELLSGYHFNSSTVSQIIENLTNESGKIFHSKTHQLVKDRDFLILCEQKTVNMPAPFFISPQTQKTTSPLPLLISVFEKTGDYTLSADKNCAHIDASAIKYPLEVRKWRKGDFFYPLGMKGKKKISDFLIDKKTNLFEKNEIWVVTSEENIVWIIGKSIDDRYKVTVKTKKIIELKINI